MITCITPTGDRPEQFKLCYAYMKRQTKIPDQWIIVDDGKTPMDMTNYSDPWIKYVRREPTQFDPKHTLRVNLLEAIKHIEHDYILIIEDDDWYAPEYIANTFALFSTGAELVGQKGSIYYSIPSKSYKINNNTAHGSLFQTGFTKSVVPMLKMICETIQTPFVDLNLWRLFRGKTNLTRPLKVDSIGIKGLGGRPGQTSSHTLVSMSYAKDPQLEKLIKWIGQDYLNYHKMRAEDKEESKSLPHGVRVLGNGMMGIPRHNAEIERWMDARYIRKYNCLMWSPVSNGGKPLADFKKYFTGPTCYFVGKGPSLDHLTAEDFKEVDAPIFAINEAIHKVESLDIPNQIFCLQLDASLGNTCVPKRGIIFIAPHANHKLIGVENKVVFIPEDYGHTMHSLSIECAIAIVRSFQTVTNYNLLCFDSCFANVADRSTYDKLNYAECIGYKPTKGGDPKRFLGHRVKIVKACGVRAKVNFLMPTGSTLPQT